MSSVELMMLVRSKQEGTMDLPILKIKSSNGDEALLHHELTEAELELFDEMDTATDALKAKSPLSSYHRIAIDVGSKHGLTSRESVAFWTRTCLMIFETDPPVK